MSPEPHPFALISQSGQENGGNLLLEGERGWGSAEGLLKGNKSTSWFRLLQEPVGVSQLEV